MESGDWPTGDMWDGNDDSADLEFDFFNLSGSCTARHIQGPVELPYSSAFTITSRAIQSVFFAFTFIFGSLLNTLVIVLVVKYKKLRTYSLLVALQIVVLSLMLALLTAVSLVNAIANMWLFGEQMCAVTGLFISTATTVRSLLMCVFVIDRYLSVFWLFTYPKYRVKVMVVLSVASWVLSLIISITLLPGLLDCYSFRQNGWLCSFDAGCNSSCFIVASTLFGIILLPITIFPIFFYARLYCKARQMKKSMATNDWTDKHEWKATITFFLLFVTVFAMTLPSIAISITIGSIYTHVDPPPAAYALTLLSSGVIYLVIVTDPIVIMRNQDMKEVLSGIKEAAFKRWKKKVSSDCSAVSDQV